MKTPLFKTLCLLNVPERDLEPDLEREGAGLRVADGLRLPEPDLEAAGDRDATELLDGDGDPKRFLSIYKAEMYLYENL